jgi:integrase
MDHTAMEDLVSRHLRAEVSAMSTALSRSIPTTWSRPYTGSGWLDKPVITAKVPRATPHDLRHTSASLAVSAGANVKAVQRMLGHASAAMTLDLFDHDLEAVAVALDKARSRATVGKMWAGEHGAAQD